MVELKHKQMPDGKTRHTVLLNDEPIGYIADGRLVPYKDMPDIYLTDLVEIMRQAKKAGLWQTTREGK